MPRREIEVRAPEDLHPDDAAMRLMLRDLLVYRRTRAGISGRELGRRLGIHQSSIVKMEGNPAWRLSTLQRWSAAMDAVLLLRPVGLPEPPDRDAMLAFRPSDPVKAQAWDRADLIGALAYARKSMRVRQSDLGEVLGCGDRAVSAVEDEDTDVLLATVQRYCRALGGALWVGLA
jgi:transcriptional regulator with XRE-family HTH domain